MKIDTIQMLISKVTNLSEETYNIIIIINLSICQKYKCKYVADLFCRKLYCFHLIENASVRIRQVEYFHKFYFCFSSKSIWPEQNKKEYKRLGNCQRYTQHICDNIIVFGYLILLFDAIIVIHTPKLKKKKWYHFRTTTSILIDSVPCLLYPLNFISTWPFLYGVQETNLYYIGIYGWSWVFECLGDREIDV